MGLSPEIKLFLLRLFPECFSKTLNETIDICILEGMPYFAQKIIPLQYSKQTMRQLSLSLKTTIHSLLNNNKVENGPIINRGLIVLLDNFYNVPGNKSLIEIKRDSKSSEFLEKTWLNEEEYINLRKEKNLKDNELIYENCDDTLDAKGIYLWRDINLRWLIHRIYSHELISIPVIKDKFLLIDEGIFMSKENYEIESKKILEKYHINNDDNNISLYEKHTLISYEMKDYMQSAIIFPEHKVKYIKSNKIGESDLKILSHIKRTENDDSYLVISPDGDILFLLLLHMKGLLNRETFDFDNKIYLDTQTTGDKHEGIEREYRYININLLYKKLIEFFYKDFRDITYPIETFTMLFLSYFSDYTEKVSPYLKIGPAKIWNSFAYLHCTNINGYIPFNTKKEVINSKGDIPEIIFERKPIINNLSSSRDFKGIINKCIKLIPGDIKELLNEKSYDGTSSKNKMGYFATFFGFDFHIDSLLKFFYYIYQQPLLPKFKKENFIKNTDPIYDYNQLLIYAKRFKDKYDPSTNNQPTTPKKLFFNNCNLDVKKAQDIINKISNKQPSTTKITIKSTMDLIREKSFNQNKNSITDLLDLTDLKSQLPPLKKSLPNKSIPDLCGLLSVKELISRITSLKWVCNYFQNGWKSPYFCQSYHHNYTTNQNLSINGWKLKIFNKGYQSISSNYLIRIKNPYWKEEYEKNNKQYLFNSIYKLFTVENAQVFCKAGITIDI